MEDTKKITDIDFHYLKTNSYRTYHADGIFGGFTPRGFLYIETFLERSPTPTMTKYKMSDSGEVGDEILREGKSGVIREIECGLIMDINAAKSFHKWLDERIKEYDVLFKGKIKND